MTGNTKNAVKAFYLDSHYDAIIAKILFPIFYRKFLKWLGEEPGEVEEKKLKMWISKVFKGNLNNIYLIIPLKERTLILEWGDGCADPSNRVFLGPTELVKEGELNSKWWREHREEVKEYHHAIWEREIWKA